MTSTCTLSTRQLLQWYVDAGVDETIGVEPQDRYVASLELKAKAQIKPEPKLEIQPETRAAPSAKPSPGTEELLLGACELAEKASTLEELRRTLADFNGCPLKKTATNLVFGDGAQDANIIFMGEAPGAEEDRQGVPFTGPGGKLLDRMLESIGLDRSKVFLSNTVFWRPPGDRSPTSSEMAVCMPFVERLVEIIDPAILVTLGGPATKSMLAQKSSISRTRGKWLTYITPRLACPIHATALFHPDYLMGTPAQKREAWYDLLSIKSKLESL